MKKVVSLKNGLVATLDISSVQNSYFIYALDTNGNLVGNCLFNIEYVFSRKLTEKEREIYARNHKIPLSEVPTKIKAKPEGIEKYLAEAQNTKSKLKTSLTDRENLNNKTTYLENGDTVTLESGKQYFIEEIKCSLLQIEALDEKFYSVGLGQAMYDEMLEIAKQYNCNKIHGFYFAHGNFMFGSQKFYKRNGFKFSTEAGMTYVTKDLTEKECQPEKNV